MVSIAVCDDNTIECLSISRRIHKYLLETGIEHTIEEYFDGSHLLESSNSFDIIFLDIKMKKIDGLLTAKILRKRVKQFILIFITSYEEYVYDAFDLEAFNYIVKPVNNKKLKNTLMRAVGKTSSKQERSIVINKNRQMIKISLGDVLYFEIRGRIINIHFHNTVMEYYEQISSLEQKLQGQNFFRCHKSYLINLQYVKKFTKNEIIMDNGDAIFLSKRRYEEFSRLFLSYMKKEGGIL